MSRSCVRAPTISPLLCSPSYGDSQLRCCVGLAGTPSRRSEPFARTDHEWRSAGLQVQEADGDAPVLFRENLRRHGETDTSYPAGNTTLLRAMPSARSKRASCRPGSSSSASSYVLMMTMRPWPLAGTGRASVDLDVLGVRVRVAHQRVLACIRATDDSKCSGLPVAASYTLSSVATLPLRIGL